LHETYWIKSKPDSSIMKLSPYLIMIVFDLYSIKENLFVLIDMN